MSIPQAEIFKTATLEAYRVHRDINSNLTHPVDVFSAIESENIVLMFQPLGNLAGAYLPSDPETGTPAGILINEKMPIAKQRYSAAHEYCHYIRKDPASLDTDDELFSIESYKRDESERIAESFAASFLMPRPLIMYFLKKVGVKSSGLLEAHDVYKLSLQMGTSYSATVNQLAALGIINPTKRKILLKIPPKAIKEFLGDEGLETSWNDVWTITEGENNSQISPKKGDVIKIGLQENATTGYKWVNEEASQTLVEFRNSLINMSKNIGGAATRVFEFKVTESGSSQLTLKQCRPWAKDAAINTFNMEVVVQDKRHGVSESLLIS